MIGERGGVIGTVFAVMLLQVLRTIVDLLGLGSVHQMTISGLISIMATRWTRRSTAGRSGAEAGGVPARLIDGAAQGDLSWGRSSSG